MKEKNIHEGKNGQHMKKHIERSRIASLPLLRRRFGELWCSSLGRIVSSRVAATLETTLSALSRP